MAVTIDGSNTPTSGGVGYGDGTELAFTPAGSAGGVLASNGASPPSFTAAGTSGQLLKSNGSSAPSWVAQSDVSPVALAPYTVLTSKIVSAGIPVASMNNNMPSIQIDTDREMILYYNKTFTSIYAVVYNSTTDTFGSPVTVRSVGASLTNTSRAILYATGQVLVVTCATSTTTIQAVLLTTSDTTITVNTATAFTASTAVSQLANLINVGSSFVFSYTLSASNKVVAMTISGTTVTFGTETAVAAVASLPVLRTESATTFLAAYASSTSAGNITAVVGTVSGTTITFGTPVNNGAANHNTVMYFNKLASGRYGLIGSGSGTLAIGSIITVSGTSLSFSNVTTTNTVVTAATAYGLTIGNQVLFSFGTDKGVVTVLTDNSGTAVLGTELLLFSSTNSVYNYPIGDSIYGVAASTSGTPDYVQTLKVSISGNNPVLSASYTPGYMPFNTSNNGPRVFNDNQTATAISQASSTTSAPVSVATSGALRLYGTTSGPVVYQPKYYGTAVTPAGITLTGGTKTTQYVWCIAEYNLSSQLQFTKVQIS